MTEGISYFENALKTGRLSHAYLISGETSENAVKEMVRRIFCTDGHRGCGQCPGCVKFDSDNHADFMTVMPTGLSIKNEQVEAFQAFMYIRPYESTHKVAVFYQAETMTERAQNRILKILEEPPAYAVMVFVTGDVEAMLPTIRSRCQGIRMLGEALYPETALAEDAMRFVRMLAEGDSGLILRAGEQLKKERDAFQARALAAEELLRHVLLYQQTQNFYLIPEQFLSILNYRDVVLQGAQALSTRRLTDLIFAIEAFGRHTSANMNFDLSVDDLLFRCIDGEV